jgi:hypothetical protein
MSCQKDKSECVASESGPLYFYISITNFFLLDSAMACGPVGRYVKYAIVIGSTDNILLMNVLLQCKGAYSFSFIFWYSR